MVYVNDILDFLWKIAPEERKENWDNVGLLVGRGNMPVTRVLTALDITNPVIMEAELLGAQLVVSHHPLIWDSCKHVTDRSIQQERVICLLERKIAAICMHTNLDEAEDGVDDTLAEILGLSPECHLAGGRIGHVSVLEKPQPMQMYLSIVRERLHAEGLRYFDAGKLVHRVATGCGSCGDYLKDAVKAGCDTFITGDVKYNVFLEAQEYGMNLIDAGHFSTENPIVEKLARKLGAEFPTLTVNISGIMRQPERYFVGETLI